MSAHFKTPLSKYPGTDTEGLSWDECTLQTPPPPLVQVSQDSQDTWTLKDYPGMSAHFKTPPCPSIPGFPGYSDTERLSWDEYTLQNPPCPRIPGFPGYSDRTVKDYSGMSKPPPPPPCPGIPGFPGYSDTEGLSWDECTLQNPPHPSILGFPGYSDTEGLSWDECTLQTLSLLSMCMYPGIPRILSIV